jgi:DNA-binding transcriptional LysR family regulator
MFDGVGHGLWKANPAVPDCTMIDWDDVRYFLAVARGGSVRAAAERLGVNHSTVLRRIAQLEERLGVHMFEKLPSGYRLTAAGEEVLEFADQMEASSHLLETRVFGRDQSVRGLLRVTLAPPLATHLLMPDFADFARLHPDIEMEILSSGELANLTNREADVAIRVVYDRKTLPLNLHSLKGPELFGGVYMSCDRLAAWRAGAPDPIRRVPTCTCTERFGFSHRGRHARRSACGSSPSSYPAGSPRTRRFSRDCPYRATDARQVAGDTCRNPVGSRAAIP